jgi:hypothetical protein
VVSVEWDEGASHAGECSSMRAAGPAARPSHPFFELRAHPFDMLPTCLIFLDGDGPADPLVARERRYVFPGRQRHRVGGERFSEISRKIMYDSSGDSNAWHRAISQVEGSSFQYENTTRIPGLLPANRQSFFDRRLTASGSVTGSRKRA